MTEFCPRLSFDRENNGLSNICQSIVHVKSQSKYCPAEDFWVSICQKHVNIKSLSKTWMLSRPLIKILGSAKPPFQNCENFVSAAAYLFCLNLLALFSQPGICCAQYAISVRHSRPLELILPISVLAIADHCSFPPAQNKNTWLISTN